MEDYTAAVIRLETAYLSMQEARRRIAGEVRTNYKIAMRKEIEAKQKSAEIEFARQLAIEAAAGLPGNIIRRDVLHTGDWARWVKWRDLAGIDPDRVTADNAKKARELAERAYRWELVPGSFTGWAFIVSKDEHGNPWHLRTEEIQFRDGRVDLYADPDDMESAAAFKRSLALYPGGELKGLNYAMRLAQSGRAETGL